MSKFSPNSLIIICYFFENLQSFFLGFSFYVFEMPKEACYNVPKEIYYRKPLGAFRISYKQASTKLDFTGHRSWYSPNYVFDKRNTAVS